MMHRTGSTNHGYRPMASNRASISDATTRSTGGIPALSLTSTGMILGTLAYMSPEQLLGEDVDARSDIFSLGVVLYEMATGQLPFSGKTPAGVMGSIITEMPSKPSMVNPAVPTKLEQVILRAVEKDRKLRYLSVALLCADLEPSRDRVQRQQPCEAAGGCWVSLAPARRASWAERSSRGDRYHRRKAGLWLLSCHSKM
jgi:serine/threonine protein kinase